MAKESNKTPSQEPVQESWWRKHLHQGLRGNGFDPSDLVAGAIGLFGGSAIASKLHPAGEEHIAPSQEDEGTFDCLITLFEVCRRPASQYVKILTSLHAYLIRIDPDWGEIFRNFFVSAKGQEAKTVAAMLQTLLDKMCDKNEGTAWDLVSKSNVFPVQRALKLCREVIKEKDAQKRSGVSDESTAFDTAVRIVATRMTTDSRLPETLRISTAKRAKDWGEKLNHFLQKKIKEKKEEGQEEEESLFITLLNNLFKIFGFVMAIVLLIAVVMALGEAIMPTPKKVVTNPTAEFEEVSAKKIGEGYDKLIQFIAPTPPEEKNNYQKSKEAQNGQK